MEQELFKEAFGKIVMVLKVTDNEKLISVIENILDDLEKCLKQQPKTTKSRPSLEEVAEYCEERQNGIDPNKWYDFYTSNGWKVGKNPMKDWKAAVRTWEKAHPAQQPQQEAMVLVEEGNFYIDDSEKYCRGYADIVKDIPPERRDRLCEWFIEKFNGQKIKLSFIRSVLMRAKESQ